MLLVVGPLCGIRRVWIIPIDGNFLMRLFIAAMIWRDGWREYRLALVEESWRGRGWWGSASPPPYGGDGEDFEVRR